MQAYDYDRYGNRTINQTSTWGNGIPKPQFTVNAATKQLGVPAGQSSLLNYDAVGNLVNDSYTSFGSTDGTPTRTFDAENRLTSVKTGAQYVVGSYTYDSDGRRTRRTAYGQETWYIYGLDGELVAEYAAGAAPASPQKEYGYRGELLVTAAPATQTDQMWFEDLLPAGAQTSAGGWNEMWSWVSANPSPMSGTAADQTPVTAGLHQQYFQNATQTLPVYAGEKLVVYVYLDLSSPPSEVMVQWREGGSWEHRAYWGANNIAWGVDGTDSRRYMGVLPQTGGWRRLEVPARQVGLTGTTLHGFALTLYGGVYCEQDGSCVKSICLATYIAEHLYTRRSCRQRS
ncbi:MAG: hypothetical protein ACJ74W_04065 [Pyrinomonadaceae bacterium]